MPQTFNINDNDFVELTNKLEKLHKSDMPLAVRGTLNSAAFKTKSISEKIFVRNFTIRKRTFYRSHSTVNKSKNTFNVAQMESEMGIIKGRSAAGDDLIHQEFGGTEKRDSIPMPAARTSKNQSKLVSKKYYLQRLKAKKVKGGSKGFIKTAHKVGKGGYLIYKKKLMQIKSLKRNNIKVNMLYSVVNNRTVRISKKPFIAPAAAFVTRKIPQIYLSEAKKRIEKHYYS